MQDLRGHTLGSYRLIEQVGIGGMAIIYKAYDPSLDRYLAIKILPAYLSHDAGFSARFRAEARNVARLRHPNILPIYGYGEEEGLSYFVMDLVEGGTLKELMGQPMEPMQAAALITQVADALHVAHQQGIVHRDVKPSNVLLLRRDWALLSDFGIARVLEGTNAFTRSGAFLGTPHYMAPEQAQGQPASPYVDQYALGIVLYEMLTGTSPYHADTPQAIVYQHVYASLPLPRERNPRISEAMERVILKALAKEPRARFPDMSAFAAAVRAAAGLPAAPPQAVEDADQAMPTPRPAAQEPTKERLDTEPVAPAVRPLAPPAPSKTGRRTLARGPLLAVGSTFILLVALGLAAFALLKPQGTAGDKPVTVKVVAPSGTSLPQQVQLQEEGGGEVKSLTPGGSTAQLSLLPGQYLLTDSSDPATFLGPAVITVRPHTPQTVHLDALYGHLTLLPAAGRVAVPGFELQDPRTGKSVTSANRSEAAQGVYVRPGRYLLSPWPADFVSPLPVTIRAHHQTTLNLARLYGQLRVTQLADAPPSGFNVYDAQTQQLRAGANADQARLGAFVPVGRYQLHFYYSDVYLDPVPVTITAGRWSRVDLNTLFARVRTPAVAKDYSVTYSWRSGGISQTLQARTKARTYYIHAGTYRLQIEAPGSARVITLHAPLGKATTLPAQ
jgi:serine/threonine protein kinase